MKYIVCILLIIVLFGCKSTKQTVKTDTKMNETVLADIAVESGTKDTETVNVVIDENTETDETITEIYYSKPDTTGTAHIVKKIETIRISRKVVNTESISNRESESIEKGIDKTISDTNIKTESRFREKEKFPIWVFVFMAMAVVAVLIIIGKFIKEIW